MIIVGEIRDRETAEIAIQASLTGHLARVAAHQYGRGAAITRLTDMGVEPLFDCVLIRGVLAQRLMRKLLLCRLSQGTRLRPMTALLTAHGIGGAVGPHSSYLPTAANACGGSGYRGHGPVSLVASGR